MQNEYIPNLAGDLMLAACLAGKMPRPTAPAAAQRVDVEAVGWNRPGNLVVVRVSTLGHADQPHVAYYFIQGSTNEWNSKFDVHAINSTDLEFEGARPIDIVKRAAARVVTEFLNVPPRVAS